MEKVDTDLANAMVRKGYGISVEKSIHLASAPSQSRLSMGPCQCSLEYQCKPVSSDLQVDWHL